LTDIIVSQSPQPPGNPHTFTSVARESDLPMGTPVTAATSVEGEGVMAASGASEALSVAVGLTTRFARDGEPVLVQYAGPISMTEAQWDAVADTSGGLTPGATYYLEDGIISGKLTETRPSAPGSQICPMGFASSPTTLIVQMGPPLDTP
jgi:hypothetical protein